MVQTKSKEVKETEKPEIEMIPIKINDLEVEVPRTQPDPMTGKQIPTTMIQACSMHGVEIPHYCYHPKLPVAGNCRMCLVEFGMPAMDRSRKPILNDDGTPQIRKMPRPAIACATAIAPNMEIYADSDGSKQMRESVLEFLLINHPLDCTICDQAGECKLQEYSYEHGQTASRFIEAKVHKPKQVDLGPRIMLDDERCILCSRCIRFTRDVAGDDALGFVNRGSYNTLGTYPGKAFDNNYTLNTVDICPVGALTSKDFRFKMRAWFMKESKSLCSSCGTGCNVMVGSRENKIYRLEPRENDAVNSSWMCDSGRLNYKWQGASNRLKEVTAKRGDIREVLSWSAALNEISDKLRSFGEGEVAFVGSAQQTTEELYLLKLLANRFKGLTDSTPNTGEGDELLVSKDKNPNTNGTIVTKISNAKSQGKKLGKIAQGIEEGSIKALVVFRTDLTKHNIPQELLESLDLLVVSDIHKTNLADISDYLLPGCAHFEKRGTFINTKGRLQKFMKAVEAPGDARPEWEFLHELVHNTTGSNGFSTIEGLFNQMAGSIPALESITWASIGDTGVNIEF